MADSDGQPLVVLAFELVAGLVPPPGRGARRRAPAAEYLGRPGRGDDLPLALDLDAWPDAAPEATLIAADGTRFGPVALAAAGPPAGRFALPYRLGPALPDGTYTVAYRWSAGGVPGLALGRFELRGGDAGGRVISLYAYRRPEAPFVVAQLSGGRLVAGRDPGT